jgi:hypothetical protein
VLKAIVGGVAAVARRLVLRDEPRRAERRGVEALQGRPAAAFVPARARLSYFLACFCLWLDKWAPVSRAVDVLADAYGLMVKERAHIMAIPSGKR